ncbi:hypothetical protein [uncultured Clostridium sp.]|uniref:hypothetical protein n=1 Tax=uncultured Clostridium sp. TaxID=59620 RepID=UPI0028EBE537|nr:hypothetical protein [uncultured Clostridium sp.]
MNYGTLKKSKLHLVANATKNISQNKSLENSLDLLAILTKLWNCISNLFNNNSESIYYSNKYYNHNTKYTVEDPTEITLISSRRTFY